MFFVALSEACLEIHEFVGALYSETGNQHLGGFTDAQYKIFTYKSVMCLEPILVSFR